MAFAFVLAIDLFVVAIAFDVTNTPSPGAPLGNASERSFWWMIALGCGIPIALISGLAVRRAYAGHRLALISACVAMATLYLAFPLGFVAPHEALTGLGRFEHNHRGVDIVLLLIPTLILLASEALRGHVEGSGVEKPNILVRLRRAPRTVGVGGAVAIVAFIWVLGADPAALTISLIILVIALPIVAEVSTRFAARRVRRDLER